MYNLMLFIIGIPQVQLHCHFRKALEGRQRKSGLSWFFHFKLGSFHVRKKVFIANTRPDQKLKFFVITLMSEFPMSSWPTLSKHAEIIDI